MSRFSPGFIFPRAGGITGFSFLGNQEIAATAATQTFTGMNFGTANASRWLIACFSEGTANRTFTSVTIGGVAATEIADSHNAGSTSTRPTSIWIANVPTGASGSVVVVMSGTNSATLALYGCISPTGLTVQGKSEQDGTSNTISIATTAGGLLLGILGGGATAVTFGGAIDTTDVSGVLVATGYRYSAGHQATPATTTASVTFSASLGSIGSCCVVSLKPT